MPTQRWLALFDELSRAKVMRVTLAGGEPLLRDDAIDLIRGIAARRMRWDLLTNGWPVTPEVAHRLKQIGRCASVEVSLGGSTEEIHELWRGQGPFGPALNATKILSDQDLPVTVRVNVHAHNIEDLPAVARLLLDDIGLAFFHVAGVSSIGTHAKYREDVFPTAAQRLRAMRLLATGDKTILPRDTPAAQHVVDNGALLLYTFQWELMRLAGNF